MDELTSEERRALREYLLLSRDERETLLDVARLLNRTTGEDRNLEHLTEILRRRPDILAVLRTAEWRKETHRVLILLGSIAGAVLAVLALYRAFKMGIL